MVDGVKEEKGAVIRVQESGTKLKCPVFSGKEVDYKVWRDKVEDWMVLSQKDVKLQGLVIKQGLEGKAYEAVMSLDKAVIRGERGGEEVLKKLDELYIKEQVWDNYDRCIGYLHIRRKKKESVRDFLMRYECLARECMNTGESELRGQMKAAHLLDSANLTELEREMVVSACGKDGLEFDAIRKIMKRIFDNSDKFEVEESWAETSNRKYYEARGRDKGRLMNSETGKNPTRNGIVTKCVICSSEYHWANKCSRNYQNRGNRDQGMEKRGREDGKGEEVRNVYASSEVEKEYWGEIEAILDTGCKSTLIGQF